MSSSFADMKAERDALQQRTFPRLQRYCKARGARFQAIDLRWGVSRALVEQNATLVTCLNEVDRCRRLSPRPTLVVILGKRYGWVPAPTTISLGTFERVMACAGPADQALLAAHYQRDLDAGPPGFALMRHPRGAPAEEWPKIEARLCELIDQHEPLVSVTEAEVRRALAGNPLPRSAFAYFREFEPENDAPLPAEFVQVEFADRLAKLRAWLETQLGPENCGVLKARFGPAGVSAEYLARLCEDVFEHLRRAIDEQLADSSATFTSSEPTGAQPSRQQPELSWSRWAEAHGREIGARLVAFLLLSRRGLTEDELLDLASGDPHVLTGVRLRYPDSPLIERLPVVLWSRVHDDLGSHVGVRILHGLPFLHASAELAASFWSEFGAELDVRQLRFYMAHYFSTQGGGVRHLDELAWLAFQNENWPRLAAAIEDDLLAGYLANEDAPLLQRYLTAVQRWRG